MQGPTTPPARRAGRTGTSSSSTAPLVLWNWSLCTCGLHDKPEGWWGDVPLYVPDPPCFVEDERTAKDGLELQCFTVYGVLLGLFNGGSIAQHEVLQSVLDMK